MPNQRHVLTVLWLLAGILLLPPLLADEPPAEPWDAPAFSVAPEALLEAAASLPAEDDDVQVLVEERSYRFDDDGRVSLRHRMIFCVLTPDGVSWSSLYATWRPWHQERPEIRARVITAAGAVHWLDPATISESPVGDDSATVLSDRLRLNAPLPAVAVGSLIEEVITLRDTAPLFDRGTVHTYLFGREEPVHRSRLVVDAPRSLPLHHVSRLLDGVEPRREESDGRVRLTFAVDGLAAVEDAEPLAPGDVSQGPQVTFSTGESWGAVARRYSEVVDAQIGAPELGRIVAEAVAGAQSREQQVARLLAWLQSEIRYTGVEFAEAAYVPRPPGMVLERKYGDCKDKATLFVALLREAGIPAHLALLNTGPGQDIEPELPGFGAFDHAIVHVPGNGRDGGELWIDPTDEFAAAGELPLADQGRLALIADAKTEALVTVPASAPADNRGVEIREIFLAAELGGARVVETARAWGSIDREYRHSFYRQDAAEAEETFADYVENVYGAEELVSWKHSEVEDLSQPFEIRLEARKAQNAYTDLEDAAVSVNPGFLLSRLPRFLLESDDEDDGGKTGSGDSEITGARKSDLVLFEPYVLEWRYRIVPPDGYRPADLPPPEERRVGPAILSREVTTGEHGEVHLTLRFDAGKRRYTPDEVTAMRQEIQDFYAEDLTRVSFDNVAAAHVAAGEIRQALAECDRLVAATPERALPHVRRSLALLAAGLGETAREEARRAVELEPEHPLAYRNLGWVLQHDLIGRLRRKGFDRDGALAAYRKAEELDPDDWITRVDLAILLEHDAEGFRYAPGAGLDAAIAEYREAFDDHEDLNLDANLLICLAWAGRFDEMLEGVETASTDPGALRVVARAATGGPAAALREARRLWSGETLRSRLAEAAATLMQLRRYPESAELFQAAARGAAKATQILELAEIMRRTRRHEEIELSDDPVENLIQRFFVALFHDQGQELKALLSSRVADRELAGPESLGVQLRVAREQLRDTNMSFDYLLDLGLANLQISTDGDETVGHRVRLAFNLGGVNQKNSFFVVHEDGQERVLCSDDQAWVLGDEALRRQQAGELEAARQWLDWARDASSTPAADDPYGGPPFYHFWQPGSGRGADEIRFAAASLIAVGDGAESAVPILKEGLEAAEGPTARRRFEIALARAYSELERYPELLEIARRWLGENPESETAHTHLSRALRGLDRTEELEKAARERAERIAADPWALRTLAQLAQQRDDLHGAEENYRRLIDSGKASSGDYNNLAWNALIRGGVTEEDLADSRRAVSISGASGFASLHTLAALYAELDRGLEAREVLLQAITAAGLEEPSPICWYVLGRIAEGYGIFDAAAKAYRQLEAPSDPRAFAASTYRLAQRRLEALESKAL